MSIERYAVLETALCIGGNLHDGEVFMVLADAHDRELAALREELIVAEQKYSKLYELNSELFDAAASLLGACEQGLYTGHAEEDLRKAIDKFTGAKKSVGSGDKTPVESIGRSPFWPASSAEELADYLAWKAKKSQPTESGASE